MVKRKNFIAPPSTFVSGVLDGEHLSDAKVHIGESVIYAGTNVDLQKWLGRGIDEWVWAGVQQLQAFINGKTQAAASLITYGRQGLPAFFNFLSSLHTPFKPEALAPYHILQFIDWLKQHPKWSTRTQRNLYTSVKTVLLGLFKRGVVPLASDGYPAKPFASGPEARKHPPSEQPLSNYERAKLAEAVRVDIVKIHQGNFTGSEAEALTVYVLALAMRTGMNTTPMLELRRDALKPHPFMPNMRLLQSHKRRGNSTHRKALRATRTDEAPKSVPMDGVALYEKALQRTSSLAAIAPHQYHEKLWLYRKNSKNGTDTEVCLLSFKDLGRGISRLIKHHDLKGDDGLPLRLNLTRLRKTMENRLWRLSNGDLFNVALVMGHDPRISDTHYLQVTPELRRNAAIVGEALPIMYREGIASQYDSSLSQTPTGSCKDSLFGERAPKDGTNHCTDFMSCFYCRSYAIIGSPEDLYRLFSFYWFLEKEKTRINSSDWRERFFEIQAMIDQFTNENFDENLVNTAKEKAQQQPHPFWKNYQSNLSRSPDDF